MPSKSFFALVNTGHTQPKEHYSRRDLESLSTGHLRKLARDRLGLRARLVGERYQFIDLFHNVLVDWSDGTDEALRELLIDTLSETLAAPG